jgi:nickel transport protein
MSRRSAGRSAADRRGRARARPGRLGGEILCLGLSLFGWTTPAPAHDVGYTLQSGEATVITLSFGDGSPFAFERYEISPEGDPTPFQVGRTDARGRIAFLAPAAGRWRLRAFAEDGHGLEVMFTTGGEASAATGERPVAERYREILIGLGLIFGVFGLVSLFRRRSGAARG